MKAVLEFNLDDPADRDQHRRCLRWASVELQIQELNHTLRQWQKHGFPKNVTTLFELADVVRANLPDVED